MNKTALVIIVLLFNISPTFPQESFISIMEKLAIENKRIDAQLSGSDYVTGIKERKNFKMDKFPFCNRELDAIYINTYKQYSAFLITYPGLFRKEPYLITSNDVIFIILSDEKEQKHYLIRYTTCGQYMYTNQEKDSVVIHASFHKDISKIIKLDSEFRPIFGAAIYPFTKQKNISMEDMELSAKFAFCIQKNILYTKLYLKEHFIQTNYNLHHVTIEELDKAMSDIDLNAGETNPWRKKDLEFLFSLSGEPYVFYE